MSENDADIIASVSCLDIHPAQQNLNRRARGDYTRLAYRSPVSHPKLHAGNINN
ncbi:hypothetical protein [Duncaniella dubosii]|uniref:hypothetical protein n=1 Tax=Duncaniella dubosii TaxID=2518971 RepID=UPI003F6772FB